MSSRLCVVEPFISPAACARLIDAGERAGLTKSPTVGVAATDAVRTSSTAFIDKADPVVAELLSRVVEHTGAARERCETPQITRYEPGQLYRAHYDDVAESAPTWPAFSARGGHRTHTVLVYLNTVQLGGGETHFEHLGRTIAPVAGRAVIFAPSSDGVLDDTMLHEARPPRSTKWVCQVWVRERPFR